MFDDGNMNHRRAVRRFNAETMFADGLTLRPPRNQDHVLTVLRQPAANNTADSAGAKNDETHGLF
jgi:hypothetical protein